MFTMFTMFTKRGALMPDKPWKATERAIARILGGQRAPITGRKGADVSHPILAIECKHRAEIPAWLKAAMQQAVDAAKPGQIPVAVLHESGKAHLDDLCIIRLGNLAKLICDVTAL